MSLFDSLLTWTTKTLAPLGIVGLFSLAFIESVFFPVPPDILLIILTLAKPENALLYALIATVGSVTGGIVGYYIGYYGGNYVIFKLISKRKFNKAHHFFDKHGAFAIFLAALTPIPYKVFTLSAGLLYLDFKRFVLASILGRGLRFFVVALLLMFFGEAIVGFLSNYFNILMIIFLIVSIILYFFYLRKKGSL